MWSPSPSSPLVKVNFDGVVFKETGNARIGVIIRDSQGLVIKSMTKKVLLPHSVAAVEALAVVNALNFAQKLNLSSIILEGDSEIVIKALKSEDESSSSRGHLTAEAKPFFDFFHYLNLSHICKQGT